MRQMLPTTTTLVAAERLPVVVALVLAVAMAMAVMWVIAEIGRRSAVRGSRQRYYWATVEHGLRYPAMAYLAISAVLDVRVYHDWLTGALALVGLALTIWMRHEKRRDGEDDDYWGDMSKSRGAAAGAKPANSAGRT